MCTVIFRTDTGNNRKAVNFTYSSPYARPITVVSVDNIIINNHRTNFLKLKFWKFLSNFLTTFNLQNVNLLSKPNVNPKNGVVYKKTCNGSTMLFSKHGKIKG